MAGGSRLSLRSVQCQIEATRTRRPLAEVALSHAFVYRVEWVVLIDNVTSLVLDQATATAIARAPNQTSAMLQAINSFIGDAFAPAAPGGELEAIVVGDLSIWLERDAAFTLAAAIRGAPPARLRDKLRETLARIRTPASYADPHLLLAECLVQEHRAPARTRARGALALAGVAVLVTLAARSYHRIAAAANQDAACAPC